MYFLSFYLDQVRKKKRTNKRAAYYLKSIYKLLKFKSKNLKISKVCSKNLLIKSFSKRRSLLELFKSFSKIY